MWNSCTIRRSIMEQPSVHSRVGKVSNPSDKQRLSISLMHLWHSGDSDKLASPVRFVYARRRMIHQNPESTGATLPIALSPKSATSVSVSPLFGFRSTLKLAGIAPAPSLNWSTFLSELCRRRVLKRKFLTISGWSFIRNANALGTKSRTKTWHCNNKDKNQHHVR